MIIFATLRRTIFLSCLFLSSCFCFGQYGGTGVFSVLKQPASARQAAWGGYSNAYRSGDANLFLANPALLGVETKNQASMNFNTQFKGIWSGNGSYAFKYKDIGFFGIGVSFINYGTMKAYDAGGNAEGVTSANETVFALGYAKPINKNISIGGNAKVVYSILGSYIGSGVMIDAGAVWRKSDSVVSVGLSIRNLGAMVLNYGNGKSEPLPFQAEIGVNFKPKHMPFRFNITAHDLQKFDLTYNQYLENNSIDLNGQSSQSKEASLPEKLMWHLAVGTELVLGKNFGIMAGYNHQRRKEMGPEVRKGVAGFSWGIHFKVSKFKITYSSASFFAGFNVNLFTFTANVEDFKRKK
jgi:hypothetical protein